MDEEILDFNIDIDDGSDDKNEMYLQRVSPSEAYKKHSRSTSQIKPQRDMTENYNKTRTALKPKYRKRLIVTAVLMILGMLCVLVGNKVYSYEFSRPENVARRKLYVEEYKKEASIVMRHATNPKIPPLERSMTPPSTKKEKDAIYLKFLGFVICAVCVFPLLFFIHGYTTNQSRLRIKAIEDNQPNVQYYA